MRQRDERLLLMQAGNQLRPRRHYATFPPVRTVPYRVWHQRASWQRSPCRPCCRPRAGPHPSQPQRLRLLSLRERRPWTVARLQGSTSPRRSSACSPTQCVFRVLQTLCSGSPAAAVDSSGVGAADKGAGSGADHNIHWPEVGVTPRSMGASCWGFLVAIEQHLSLPDWFKRANSEDTLLTGKHPEVKRSLGVRNQWPSIQSQACG